MEYETLDLSNFKLIRRKIFALINPDKEILFYLY